MMSTECGLLIAAVSGWSMVGLVMGGWFWHAKTMERRDYESWRNSMEAGNNLRILKIQYDSLVNRLRKLIPKE